MSELLKQLDTPQALVIARRQQWRWWGLSTLLELVVVGIAELAMEGGTLSTKMTQLLFLLQIILCVAAAGGLIVMLVQEMFVRSKIAHRRRVFEHNDRKVVQQIYAARYEEMALKIKGEEQNMEKLVKPIVISCTTSALGFVAFLAAFVVAWIQIFSSPVVLFAFAAAVLGIGAGCIALLRIKEYLAHRANYQLHCALQRDYTHARHALHEGDGGAASGTLSLSDGAVDSGGELTLK